MPGHMYKGLVTKYEPRIQWITDLARENDSVENERWQHIQLIRFHFVSLPV